MDQGPLVTEQIDAGARLVHEFDRYAPVAVAYWLKEMEDRQWFLHLASDRINDGNVRSAYGEVLRILHKAPNLWLHPLQVKVTGVDNPVAREAMDIQRHYPSGVGIHHRTRRLGGLTVEEVFIYPAPVPVPSP